MINSVSKKKWRKSAAHFSAFCPHSCYTRAPALFQPIALIIKHFRAFLIPPTAFSTFSFPSVFSSETIQVHFARNFQLAYIAGASNPDSTVVSSCPIVGTPLMFPSSPIFHFGHRSVSQFLFRLYLLALAQSTCTLAQARKISIPSISFFPVISVYFTPNGSNPHRFIAIL